MATARERAYERIRARIFSGKYPPSFQLREEELGADLRMSRTPVRQAIRQLADQGLVTIRSNHRSYVSDVTESQFEQTFDLLAFLEGYSAGLAATHISDEDLRKLRRLVDEMGRLVASRPNNHREFLANNYEFHQTIHAASGNHTLHKLLGGIVEFPHSLYLKFGQINASHNPKSVVQHGQIVEALERRDPEFAAAQMRMHLESVRRSFRELWSQYEERNGHEAQAPGRSRRPNLRKGRTYAEA